MPNDYTNMADRFWEGYDATNPELRATKRDEQRKMGLLAEGLDMRNEKEYSLTEKKELLAQRIKEMNDENITRLSAQYPQLKQPLSNGMGGAMLFMTDGSYKEVRNERKEALMEQEAGLNARVKESQVVKNLRPPQERAGRNMTPSPSDINNAYYKMEELIDRRYKAAAEEETVKDPYDPVNPIKPVPGAKDRNKALRKQIEEEVRASAPSLSGGMATTPAPQAGIFSQLIPGGN